MKIQRGFLSPVRPAAGKLKAASEIEDVERRAARSFWNQPSDVQREIGAGMGVVHLPGGEHLRPCRVAAGDERQYSSRRRAKHQRHGGDDQRGEERNLPEAFAHLRRRPKRSRSPCLTHRR